MMETGGKVESVPPPESVFTKMASMGSGKFKVKSKVKDPVNVFKIESEVSKKVKISEKRNQNARGNKSKQKGAIFESILNGNIDNKTDARDEETITEVDDKMVKNSKANPEVIFDKAPMPIEFADVTSAEDDDQLTALKTSPGSKYPKSEPKDAATLNPQSNSKSRAAYLSIYRYHTLL